MMLPRVLMSVDRLTSRAVTRPVRCLPRAAQTLARARTIEMLMTAAIKRGFDPTDAAFPGHFQQAISLGVRSQKWPRPR